MAEKMQNASGSEVAPSKFNDSPIPTSSIRDVLEVCKEGKDSAVKIIPETMSSEKQDNNQNVPKKKKKPRKNKVKKDTEKSETPTPNMQNVPIKRSRDRTKKMAKTTEKVDAECQSSTFLENNFKKFEPSNDALKEEEDSEDVRRREFAKKFIKSHLKDTTTNPLNGQPFSKKYYKILKERAHLPVFRFKEEFLNLLEENQTLVVAGETGCGKTTQVPQWCVEFLFRQDSKNKLLKNQDSENEHLKNQDSKNKHLKKQDPKLIVGCIQPRRLAASSVATRVAKEMDVELGSEVGYHVRFENCTSEKTVLKYMTDGLLLRVAGSDSNFEKYAIIIIDEAHERGLNTDIVTGLVKRATERRSDLKIVVMSATLDEKKFQTFYEDCPVMTIPGRLFPVDIFHFSKLLPNSNIAWQTSVTTALEIHKTGEIGDILVFLPGLDEVEEACCRIEEMKIDGSILCLPLYKDLSRRLQIQAISAAPSQNSKARVRKIVVATNIAEASLTIDGMKFVIDSGYCRENQFYPKGNFHSLRTTMISKASASQRSGRSGRTSPGKCYRLFTQEEFEGMRDHKTPDILRADIANSLLNLKKLGIRNFGNLLLLDSPTTGQISCAENLLEDLGAIDGRGNLTSLGRKMARLPLEPRLAKVLISSIEFDCLEEMLSISAMLSVQPCFGHPSKEFAEEAKIMWKKFYHPDGDHMTLFNIFQEYCDQSDDDYDNWCREHFLLEQILEDAWKIRDQLESIISNMNITISNRTFYYRYDVSTNVRRALLSGYFRQIAYKEEPKGGSTAEDIKDVRYVRKKNELALIHPTSSLIKINPKSGPMINAVPEFVVYQECFCGNKGPKYLRTVSRVNREWIISSGHIPNVWCNL